MAQESRELGRRQRPTLVFDGDCGFCRWWVRRWRASLGERLEYVAYQDAGARFPQISKEEFERSVQLVETDGRVYKGAEAVLRSLATDPSRRWPCYLYRKFPGFAPAAEAAYRFIAKRRGFASRVTLWLWGPDPEPPSFRLARWLIVRAVAVIFLIAFLSLWVQVDGLLGPKGILPTDQLLKTAAARIPAPTRWFLLPTLCWLGGGGAFLHALCAAGCAAAVLAAAGWLSGPMLLACWACYLSLCSVGMDFMAFQWDNLLLEAGLLAAFYAPLRLRSRLRGDCDALL